MDRHDMRRQVRQHLESLKAAGLEWLPIAPARSPSPPEAATAGPTVPPPRPASKPMTAAAPELFAQSSLLSADADSAMTPEQRRRELVVLGERVASCTRCSELAATRSQTVFGIGPIDAELCFVGEAPGADEDRQGEPFVGKAGQLLDRIIAAIGMKREEVYICNIIKCRPPGNRTPSPDEAAHCREYLERQLALVRPRFLCCLGATAVRYLLGVTDGITKIRGSFLEYRGIPVLCTFHPSYLLRVPTAKRDVWEDMKKLLQRMGRPVPGTNGS